MAVVRKKKKAVVARDECVSCGWCARNCPISAISIFGGMYALVDEDKCVGCGRCAVACPASVITIEIAEEVA